VTSPTIATTHADRSWTPWVAGVALVIWLVLLCWLPDPRPLGAPEWAVGIARRVVGLTEPQARFVATALLRGAGVGLIGVLLAIALHGWYSRYATAATLVGAPFLAVTAKYINFGAVPIRPQLVAIVVVAFLGALAGLALRRNRAALVGLTTLTFGLVAWGTSTRVPDNLYEAWRSTALHVLESANDVPDGDEGFRQLLQIAFAYAEDNSHGTDAVLPNRAAVLALGKILGEDKVARVGGRDIDLEDSGRRERLRQRILLGGRNDLSRHYWVSAALTVLSDPQRALTVGLSKELMDSTPGGSGFSFVDMAANATGIRLAVAATRDQASAHDLQVRVREDEYVAKLLPSVDGLPEQLSRDALQSDLGGLGGSETRRLLDEIDRRISALPLFR
jgi:hypothetical protein